VSNHLNFSHSWSTTGDYIVTFTAFNTDNPGGVSASVTIFVLQNPVHYVTTNNATPVAPYLSWATAATNIQDAVDAAFAGGTVVVSNGLYPTGAQVALDGSTNRVAIAKPLVLQSANGPVVTAIDGGGAMRCLYLTNHVSVTGFTLQNGHEISGGGVWGDSTNIVVSNCLLARNSAVNGGGAFQALLENCALVANAANTGGGASSCTLNQCTLTGNSAANGGGRE